ncbi:hypothetical protein CRYUN_Cryun34aG0044600 [Craigia yunnanensis]
MEKAPEIQVQIMGQEDKDANSVEQTNGGSHSTATAQHRSYKWWLVMAIYTLFVLAGQSVATLLGRLYYEKGGKNRWLITLVQPVGFPVLIPLYFLSAYKTSTQNSSSNITNPPSILVLSVMYIALGILFAAYSMLYSLGLLYLPVSTYSLICTSQLAFNAFFSFYLNSQKFTPFTINSLVLITMSSTLLVFQNNSSGSTTVSKGNGEYKSLDREMEGFKLGKVSYVNTLVWIAIALQVFSFGSVGLIFEVYSLFSNVISTLEMPIVPVLAIVFFHDKMTGVKVISMLLAIWGFVSYVYQHYVDDRKS